MNNPYPVVLLFTRHDDRVVEHLKGRYPEVEIHVYEDRPDQRYISSVRGWLWYKYLVEDRSREKETYFYIDSDIIFRELPDLSKIKPTARVWYGANCAGYLDYDYLSTRTEGKFIIQGLANLAGITEEDVKKIPGAGAQWVIAEPTAEFWEATYRLGNAMWMWLKPIKSDIQKWTAEMWANLYAMKKFGITVKIHHEIDHCTPTDNVQMWDVVKILHNAGVPAENSITFYKGKYDVRTPFNDDLSYVRKDKASIKYVQAIKEVIL